MLCALLSVSFRAILVSETRKNTEKGEIIMKKIIALTLALVLVLYSFETYITETTSLH